MIEFGLELTHQLLDYRPIICVLIKPHGSTVGSEFDVPKGRFGQFALFELAPHLTISETMLYARDHDDHNLTIKDSFGSGVEHDVVNRSMHVHVFPFVAVADSATN